MVASYLRCRHLSSVSYTHLDVYKRQVGDATSSRITLLGKDGQVLFDSIENPKEMENHSNRPEFIEAEKQGSGEMVRYSDTLSKPVSYTHLYKEPQFKRTFSAKSDSGSYYRNSSSAKKKEKEYLLVDGYNIIYAWEDLKELADANLHAAQTKLMDILSNYQGFKKCTLILVFDAYKIEGHAEEVITYHNIHVVYTKEAETADQYIEKTVHKIGRENQVTVATSDGLEQIIIMGQGAHRMSARGLRDEIKATENQIRQQCHEKRQSSKNYLIDNISDEMAQYMKEKRLGKQ